MKLRTLFFCLFFVQFAIAQDAEVINHIKVLTEKEIMLGQALEDPDDIVQIIKERDGRLHMEMERMHQFPGPDDYRIDKKNADIKPVIYSQKINTN